eukprot:423111-Amphidinium_carterae.1
MPLQDGTLLESFVISNSVISNRMEVAFGQFCCKSNLDVSVHEEYVDHRLSTGPIPASLQAAAVLLSHNLLQGSIPQHLLDGGDPLQKWVAVSTSVSRF